MLYFGYGSNMCTGRLQARVSSARPIGKRFLRGYRFRFNKRSIDQSAKGNVERTSVATDLVWGVLFDFDASQKHLLDQAEGLGQGYDELTATVESEDGKRENALLYVAAASHLDNTRQPYSWYKRFVLEGARQHSLPQDYIEFLDSFQARTDPNHARDAREQAITC